METFFSKNADILLKQNRLTQSEFCQKLGKSKSNWDNIVKTNNLEMLSQIAKVLNMSLDDIIGLNHQKFTICGFVKVDDVLYEITTKDEIIRLLSKVEELECL